MPVDKYLETPDELAHFQRSSQHLRTELNFLLQLGMSRLVYGMRQWKYVDKKPSFVPDKPPYTYDEKNLYVDAANNLWIKSMWSFPPLDEIYYDALLRGVKEFKAKEEFDFNKGIVYANLGVAQAAQMKIDEGFANILKALIEDSGYSASTPEYDLFRRNLFTQFEDRYVKTPLQKIILQLNLVGTSPTEQFMEGLLDSLSDSERAFFDCTIGRIMQNWGIWKEKENGFTASRLLAYMQDYCLFNEDFLKSKIRKSKILPRIVLSSKLHWELRDMLQDRFPRTNLRGCGAKAIADLDKALTSDLSSQNLLQRCLRILLTLRNYSSHNVSGGTSANCFYARFDEVLAELVRATCQVHLLP